MKIAAAALLAGLLPSGFDLSRHIEKLPMQNGDVLHTHADTSSFERDFGFVPGTGLDQGLGRFVEWYKEYNNN